MRTHWTWSRKERQWATIPAEGEPTPKLMMEMSLSLSWTTFQYPEIIGEPVSFEK